VGLIGLIAQKVLHLARVGLSNMSDEQIDIVDSFQVNQ
jgi:hypothetical protein